MLTLDTAKLKHHVHAYDSTTLLILHYYVKQL